MTGVLKGAARPVRRSERLRFNTLGADVAVPTLFEVPVALAGGVPSRRGDRATRVPVPLRVPTPIAIEADLEGLGGNRDIDGDQCRKHHEPK